MSHERSRCEAADTVAPEATCSHSGWRVLWVPTGPELHGVKMAPYTYVGRYACTTHEDLYWQGVAMRTRKTGALEPNPSLPASVTNMTLF